MHSKITYSPDPSEGGGLPPLSRQDKKHSQIAELRGLYARVMSGETVTLREPLDVSGLFSPSGIANQSFPLLDGGNLGMQLCFGLPRPSIEQKVVSAVLDKERNGVMLTLTTRSQDCALRTYELLVLKDKLGRDAIKTKFKLQREALVAIYQRVLDGEELTLKKPLDVSELLGPSGQINRTFPLLDGGNLGKQLGIGFPNHITDQRVTSAVFDNERNGVWLTLTAINQDGELRTCEILILKDRSDTDAITTKLKLQREAVVSLYQRVLGGEAVTLKKPLDVSELIGPSGNTNQTFLLIDEGNQQRIRIGLPSPSTEAKLINVALDVERNGVWLTLTAKNKHGELQTCEILILKDKSGSDAIKTKFDLQREAVVSLYQQVLGGEEVTLEKPLDISKLIGQDAVANQTFPLIDGGNLGKRLSIGLPQPCIEPKITNAVLDKERNGVWLTLTAKDKDGELRTCQVLILKDKSGHEAIKTKYDLQREALVAIYQRVLGGEEVILNKPFDVSELLAPRGYINRTFPLLDGGNLEKMIGIGLSEPSIEPKITNAVLDHERNGVWLTLTAKNKYGELQTSEILILKDKSGHEAIKTKYDLQREAVVTLYKRVLSDEKGTLEKPLDLSELIGRKGIANKRFPLLDSSNLGEELGFGLPRLAAEPRITNAALDKERSGVWLTLTAKNRDGELRASEILILKNKSGSDAIKTKFDLQREAVVSLYQQVLGGEEVTLEKPLDISELIGQDAVANQTFPLIDGGNLGKRLSIGLPQPCIEPKITNAVLDKERNGVWLTHTAKNKYGELQTSEILIQKDKSGIDAIKTKFTLQREALVLQYQQALSGKDVTLKKPFDVYELFGSNGQVNKTFPLLDGSNVGKKRGIGLPNPCYNVNVIDVEGIDQHHVAVTLNAENASNQTIQTTIIVTKNGILRGSERAPENLKGFVLDRYLSHLLATKEVNGVANPWLAGSKLTREFYKPNVASGRTVLHAKWGNSSREMLHYILKYERMHRWNRESVDYVVHLLGGSGHVAEIQALCGKVEGTLGITNRSLSVQSLASFVQSTFGIDQRAVTQELRAIERMSELGQTEWLKNKRYEPALPNASHTNSSAQQSADWKAHVRSLPYPLLIEALDTHRLHHSLFWEREYHLTLVRHCSYLIDQCLHDSDLSQSDKDTVRQKVFALYPELEQYPNAWELLREGAGSDALEQDGIGGEANLTEFNLLEELNVELESRVNDEPPFDFASAESQAISIYLDSEFSKVSSVKEFFARVRELQSSLDQAAKEKLAEQVFSWIKAKVLDIEANQELPERLLELKELRTKPRKEEILSALESLPARFKLILRDYSHSKISDRQIRSEELVEELKHVI